MQLHASEYSLNTAIYTLLKTIDRVIIYNILNTNIIDIILPGIAKKYGKKDILIYLNGTPDANLNYLMIK